VLHPTDASSSALQVRVASDTEGQATNSMSLLRRPGAIEDFHRGSSSHVPFFPGGAELPKEQASRRALDRSTVVLDFDLESLKRCTTSRSNGTHTTTSSLSLSDSCHARV